MAALLCEKVRTFSQRLPEGHILRLRQVFYDLYGTDSYFVDYLYHQGNLPLYTQRELCHVLDDEFDGIIYEGSVRYLEESFHSDHFTPDSDEFYSAAALPQERYPVCQRDGHYVADLSSVFCSAGNSFYLLDGLLPNTVLDRAYVKEESHWIADWGQKSPRFARGETVRFDLKSISKPTARSHTPAACNLTVANLERAQL